VKVGEQLQAIWRQATGAAGGRDSGRRGGCGGGNERRWASAILSPVQFRDNSCQADTDESARFAETPVVPGRST